MLSWLKSKSLLRAGKVVFVVNSWSPSVFVSAFVWASFLPFHFPPPFPPPPPSSPSLSFCLSPLPLSHTHPHTMYIREREYAPYITRVCDTRTLSVSVSVSLSLSLSLSLSTTISLALFFFFFFFLHRVQFLTHFLDVCWTRSRRHVDFWGFLARHGGRTVTALLSDSRDCLR